MVKSAVAGQPSEMRLLWPITAGLLAALWQLIIAIHLAAAQDPEDLDSGHECLSGQYVLSRSSTPALRDKAMQAMEEASPVDLVQTAETSSAMLVQEITALAGIGRRPPAAVPSTQSNICRRVRKLRRFKEAAARRNGAAAILRRVGCSCNSVLYAERTPDDPNFPQEWGLYQPNGVHMNLPAAWDITTGSGDTVVAVIDTGVDYNHPDLSSNLWQNPGEIAGNGVDDDHNGYVDDIYGINAITNSGNPMDDHGHGTHVSGTIGALSNNGIGVTGINWQVKIIGAKFLSSSGSGSLYDAIKCVDYITNLRSTGVNVVLSNNSWGGGGYSQALYDAIWRARGAGILFVAAAGNSGADIDATPSYPAAYPADNIVAVAAVAQSGSLASFSNWGQTRVDIGAPGVNIASTYFQNRYAYMSGTSMAAPHVSGALALLSSFAPGLSWQGLRDNLYATGTPLSSLSGKTVTGKMANAYSMLAAAGGAPPATPTPTPTLTPTPAPTATPQPTLVPTPTPTPLPTPGIFKVTGKVTDAFGNPVAQAKVIFRYDGRSLVRYSGALGTFDLGGIDGPVNYSIETIKAGYSFPGMEGYLTRDLDLRISGQLSQYTIRGRALADFDGELVPVPGAVINCGSLGSVTADDSGEFSLQAPYGSQYALTISSPEIHFERATLSGTVLGDVRRLFVGELN